MNLTDAFLLDPHRDPREVWLVPARADGQRGDGSQASPYNAAPIPHPSLDIISLSHDGTTAIAVTGDPVTGQAYPHGFKVGDMVTIAGALSDNPWANPTSLGELYLGTFPVASVESAERFTYVMLTNPVPAVLPTKPQCWREREQFDAILRAVPPNATVHLGPGVFETKGLGTNVAGGWMPKTGQRIVGSGMSVTFLKIVGAYSPYRQHSAIGTFGDPVDTPTPAHYLDGFEASDFTIDCNLDGQPINYYYPDGQPASKAVCGAIALLGGGRHIRIHRVRAIHFGSRAPHDFYIENFVFLFLAYNPSAPPLTDCVVEDCIAEHPSPNISWNSSLFVFGGTYDGVSRYHRGCVFRNNYVNCEIVYGPVVAIDSIGYNAGIATVTTKWPHGYTPGGNVSIQGVLVNGSADNAFNGVFAIEQASGTQITYRPYAADNPTAAGLGVRADTVIGAPVSPHLLTIDLDGTTTPYQTYHIKQVDELTPRVFRLTTILPHNLTVHNVIKLNGVWVNEIEPPSVGTIDLRNPFNGTFPVTAVISKKVLEFTLDRDPTPAQSPAPPFTFNWYLPASGAYIDPAIGEGHAAFGVDTGTGAVMEGNRIFRCATGGPWHDTASTLDWVTRKNYYHDVLSGPNQNMGHILNFKPCQLTGVGGILATCTLISGTHDLVVGQGVSVQDLADPPTASEYYGIFTIKSVSPSSFTYEMKSIPTVPAPGNPYSYFAGAAQVGNCIIENNVIETAPSRPGYWARPTGIIKTVPTAAPLAQLPYLFRQVVIRGNVIRQVNSPPDPDHFGIIIHGAEKLLAENNVIDVGAPQSIQFNKCAAPGFFNNQSPAGKLIQGYDQATQRSQDELATRIADALVLSL